MARITNARYADNKSTSHRLDNGEGEGGEKRCGYIMLMARLDVPPHANVALGSSIGSTTAAHASGQRTVPPRVVGNRPMTEVTYNTATTEIGTSFPFANLVTGNTADPLSSTKTRASLQPTEPALADSKTQRRN